MTKERQTADLSDGQPTERKLTGPRCSAHKKDGTQCKNRPIRGGTTCMKHGGAAKQVRTKANERLLEMVMPALTKLRKIILSPKTSDADAIRAVREVLNRTGFTERFALTIEPDNKWDNILEDVIEYDRSGLVDDRSALEQSKSDLAYGRKMLAEAAESDARREWADLEEEEEERDRERSGVRLVDPAPNNDKPRRPGPDQRQYADTGYSPVDKPERPTYPSEHDRSIVGDGARTREEMILEAAEEEKRDLRRFPKTQL